MSAMSFVGVRTTVFLSPTVLLLESSVKIMLFRLRSQLHPTPLEHTHSISGFPAYQTTAGP